MHASHHVGMRYNRLMKSVRVFVDPTIVIISTKMDDLVYHGLDPEGRGDASDSGGSKSMQKSIRIRAFLTMADDQFRLPFLLEVRPPSEFSYRTAKGTLAGLRLGGEHAFRRNFIVPADVVLAEPAYAEEVIPGKQGRMLHLSGLIDMESPLTVCSVHLE